MFEFQAHICWVISVDYKARLDEVKSEFYWKIPKLTRSVRASKMSYILQEIQQCVDFFAYSLKAMKTSFPGFLFSNIDDEFELVW